MNQGDSVTFNNKGPSFGLVPNGSPVTSITVADTGTYTIEFHVRGTETSTPANATPLIFQVDVNTVLIPGASYASEDSNPANSHRAVTGIVTANFNSGDVITLQNQTASPTGATGPTTVRLTNDNPTVNASLRIERIGTTGAGTIAPQ